MRFAYPASDFRAADTAVQQLVDESVLIDRASSAVARRAAAMLGSVYGAHVCVLAGSGHNGADALWAGRKLQQRGARVDVVLGSDPRDEHGAEPLRRLRAAGARTADPSAMRDCGLVIDGLAGIGFTGALRDPSLADHASAAALVLAVDVPSGVDADTGAVAGAAVRAHVTVTFGGLKPGLLLDPGAEYAGQVEVADIGLAAQLGESRLLLLGADDVAAAFGTPHRESSKYTRGVVGVVAGSDRYTGAAVLCCGGAVRAGAGMVQLVSAGPAAALVRASWPEVVAVSDGDPATIAREDKVTAWVVGPGLGTDDRATALVAAVLASGVPVIVDADGLTIAAKDPQLLKRSAPTVVTPHLGEFARLTGASAADTRNDRLGAARRAADALGVTVLLKGTTTVVAEPGGPAYINATGTPWLSTAGTGDVLSGVIGALLARGIGAAEAAATGAWVHGLAGRLSAVRAGPDGPIAAGDVIRHLPAAIAATRSAG
ncbi:MAG: ADP-dependent NAD(P)H-hydrate dehydratase / NAD(P)H-hydrate epimerase [Frankiaceae bacterium]|nr:ADP-dependent NAD(P)H-hydrate dehydratase / NAD(P)H-hydrate epimerase [Frankiaceae bacterium]